MKSKIKDQTFRKSLNKPWVVFGVFMVLILGIFVTLYISDVMTNLGTYYESECRESCNNWCEENYPDFIEYKPYRSEFGYCQCSCKMPSEWIQK